MWPQRRKSSPAALEEGDEGGAAGAGGGDGDGATDTDDREAA